MPRRGVLAVFCALLAASGALAQSGEVSKAAVPHGDAAGFAVATIKPSDPHDSSLRIEFRPNGFTARGIMLRELIQEAYGTYEENRLEGGPAWLKTSRFDVEAKIDNERTPGFADLSLDQRRAMLRELLSDRFQLAMRQELRELPVYALVVGRGGPKLRAADTAGMPEFEIKGLDSLVTRSGVGELEARNFTMSALALNLAGNTGRVVVDRTGLPGRYDIALHWTPDNQPVRSSGGSSPDGVGSPAEGPVWPSLFTALQEQLGLRLDATRDQVSVLVVERAEMPSEN